MKISRLVKYWAELLKRDILALWFALKNPQMPFIAKGVGFFTVAYALSPIDLIPDFIPILGLLDDLILVPILVWLTIRLTPKEILNHSHQQAKEWLSFNKAKPFINAGIIIVVVLWLMYLWLLI